MKISTRIKNKRKELGLTQLELALKAGITQQAINAIERDLVEKPKNIIEIARALKCSPEWLYDGKKQN